MKKLFITLMIPTYILALGFQSGDTYKSTKLTGAVGIICNNGMNIVSKMYRCNKEQLLPVMNEYIVGNNLDADKVSVEFSYKNKQQIKKRKFDMESQRTKKTLNLWKKNLWNKPILKEGENTVRFKAYKSGVTVEEETRIINVENIGESYCGSATLKSKDLGDCYSMANACELFYKATNYCQKY
ncbi:MAG: hypothetical protein BM556_04015 [Bacteriovorax sp. MedPE-SWde]|nr:MAG: hypothetical protein BM556_04015 [Bacteriovorax sp. MedPE-SWde]